MGAAPASFNAGPLLGQRQKRWPIIEPVLGNVSAEQEIGAIRVGIHHVAQRRQNMSMALSLCSADAATSRQRH